MAQMLINKGSRRRNDYNCWIPVGSPGFITLGVFCQFEVDDQPHPTKEDLLIPISLHFNFLFLVSGSYSNTYSLML